MRLLLDTHALFWWLISPMKLTRMAHDAIAEGEEVFVSAASAWEIATKARIGRWDAAKGLIADWHTHVATEGFTELAISATHARRAGLMSGENKDPFDRLLAAQAEIEGLRLVSADTRLREFNVEVVW